MKVEASNLELLRTSAIPVKGEPSNVLCCEQWICCLSWLIDFPLVQPVGEKGALVTPRYHKAPMQDYCEKHSARTRAGELQVR
jgi:hypothetical protein